MSTLFNILNTAWCIEDVLCLIATCFPKPPLPSRPESSESSLSFVHSLQLLLVFCCTSLSAGSPFYTIMSLCLESIWIHSLPLHRASRCRMLPAPVIHNRSARWSWLNIQSAYSIHSWVNTAIQSVWACAFVSPCACARTLSSAMLYLISDFIQHLFLSYVTVRMTLSLSHVFALHWDVITSLSLSAPFTVSVARSRSFYLHFRSLQCTDIESAQKWVNATTDKS